jgi:hypothetical protein
VNNDELQCHRPHQTTDQIILSTSGDGMSRLEIDIHDMESQELYWLVQLHVPNMKQKKNSAAVYTQQYVLQ